MFAEGDLFGTTPTTFEILLSGFQSDAHLNQSLRAEQGLQYRIAFFLARTYLSGTGTCLLGPLKAKTVHYGLENHLASSFPIKVGGGQWDLGGGREKTQGLLYVTGGGK